jgi:hypothetical protein
MSMHASATDTLGKVEQQVGVLVSVVVTTNDAFESLATSPGDGRLLCLCSRTRTMHKHAQLNKYGRDSATRVIGDNPLRYTGKAASRKNSAAKQESLRRFMRRPEMRAPRPLAETRVLSHVLRRRVP